MDDDLRLAIYHKLASTGQLPSDQTLAASLRVRVDEIWSGVRRLADARHLVLGPDGEIVLAHPFATRTFGFAVMGERTLWWGGCAWDSFAIPHLVPTEPEVLVSTRCPGCARPLAWVVGRDEPPTGTEVAHFLVPVSQIWDDVIFTCDNQRLFCDDACVDRWLGESGNEPGYVMDLGTLWRLASHWYDGRLDPGYVRREPAAAREYFASVGLRGAFWGLTR